MSAGHEHRYPLILRTPRSRAAAGGLLFAAGLLVLLDQALHTGWLGLAMGPLIGVLLFLFGVSARSLGYIVTGGLLAGFGAGGLVAVTMLRQAAPETRLGALLAGMALSWLVVTAGAWAARRWAWWALLPAAALTAPAVGLLSPGVGLPQLVLLGGSSLAAAFLIWGAAERLLGLVIPGSLLAGIAPGLYYAWPPPAGQPNYLAQIGILIVSLALGWALISLIWRMVSERNLTWPLIPAGVCGMVGWGLYIGGSPDSAAAFIGNTGSVGLMIFGLYLLLWRRSISR